MPNENDLVTPAPGADGPAGRKRPPAAAASIPVFVAVFFGLLGFYRVTQSPQFASYRTLDVVQLVVSGAGFGVALTALIFWLVRQRA